MTASTGTTRRVVAVGEKYLRTTAPLVLVDSMAEATPFEDDAEAALTIAWLEKNLRVTGIAVPLERPA